MLPAPVCRCGNWHNRHAEQLLQLVDHDGAAVGADLIHHVQRQNQHVGNFPGVTVDRKDGVIRGHAEATVTDLPGIYSLSPYSSEEIVTRDFLLNTHPDLIHHVQRQNQRNVQLHELHR